MGCQGLSGERFAETRRVVTGSWLGQRFQGHGYGTEMRAAVLELAFAGLGAEVAVSGHADGNTQSMRVSEKLGYETVGEGFVEPRGYPIRQLELELPATAGPPPADPGRDRGLEPCLALFGLRARGLKRVSTRYGSVTAPRAWREPHSHWRPALGPAQRRCQTPALALSRRGGSMFGTRLEVTTLA